MRVSGKAKRARERERAEAERRYRHCHHCLLVCTGGPEHVGDGTIEAWWVDADGSRTGPYMVCDECLNAGAQNGPGYQEVSEC